MRIYFALLLTFLISGCGFFGDKFTVQENRSTGEFRVIDLEGLDRHETIEYFNSKVGQQCYRTFGEYFKWKSLQEKASAATQPNAVKPATDTQYAIDRAFTAIENISYENAKAHMKNSDNMRDVALAAHGFEPSYDSGDDMMSLMKSMCQSYGYYDWKRDQDVQQYAFWTSFSKGLFKMTTKLGLGYLFVDGLKHAFDRAGDTIESGGDVIKSGEGSIDYNPDNRVNQVGGVCPGEIGSNGECIVSPSASDAVIE